ncbi:hypothetical protein [Legionella jordanis]|uniref:Uncharacterized protein n=1 Tax=Legionella jordanis TaxID=456 RepID=A0A0W0V7V9_9GAMM|nr:hypothetical protein [Legionella jordanis]KTD16225.1 hypothetical protein Ljor_0531 [Legionella jordanis]RMX04555.1 hypothetical protein EAW55_03730 [Legionella jordanis]VEH12317.1 Uncharacterised protein [Legionella jordanis]HAT8713524.1 hypothetical protein [Legionella jordanis]
MQIKATVTNIKKQYTWTIIDKSELINPAAPKDHFLNDIEVQIYLWTFKFNFSNPDKHCFSIHSSQVLPESLHALASGYCSQMSVDYLVEKHQSSVPFNGGQAQYNASFVTYFAEALAVLYRELQHSNLCALEKDRHFLELKDLSKLMSLPSPHPVLSLQLKCIGLFSHISKEKCANIKLGFIDEFASGPL